MAMLLAVLVCLVGAAVADYGQVPPQNPSFYDPPAYPGGSNSKWPRWYPDPFPRHRGSHSNRDSGSRFREEKECRSCKKLSLFKNDPFFIELGGGGLNVTVPEITYYNDNTGCRKALITCPLNRQSQHLIVPHKNWIASLTSGLYPQRVVKCNKNGKYRGTAIFTDKTTGKSTVKTVYFSKVACAGNIQFS